MAEPAPPSASGPPRVPPKVPASQTPSLPPSLASRVLKAVLLILLAGGLLVAGATLYNGRLAARQSYDRILLGAARDIAGSIHIQSGRPIVDLPVSAFELLAQAPEDRIHYAVRGPGNTLITGLDETDIAPPARRGGASSGPEFFDARLNGEPARFVRVTRRFAERDFSGSISVTVGQTLRARQAMALGLTLDTVLPMLLAGLALLVMSWLVTRSALRPLEAMSEDLAARDPYDLTPVPTDGLPRELTVMLEAMNRFMGRLDRQMEGMRHLISDAAHQLRTPVAAIRVQAEAMQDQPDDALRARALSRLLTRTRSLGSLLDQLLSRALVSHRSESVPRAPLDLREVALEVVERGDHELLAPEAELRLEIGEEPVMVRADAFSVGEAAKNLLVNALKHGASPIAIGAELRGTEAALWVRDAGAGPAPEIAARLGQRFERSTASHEDSAGLGLAIVASVAAAFGGRIALEYPGGGFRIALLLPAAPQEDAPE
ncbi:MULTISPECIES: sensor histidine kinase [unclassified Salipiger]|uniref:sensor histidine kinase n=1 Tax=unclassified Salipiger TaxID=2640570 RepID=UPI0013B81EC5|nr:MULTISPECIES: sensor histidine kinase [unclassified Salipiger]NDV49613.1 sensor histidine kinase [Salipiger sp. PrR003]NDW34479.1 sensor histidine kinase [Salipiger sp. PrR007]